MSKLNNKKNIPVHQINTYLFLTLICFTQAFQFSHLHHFHENDALAFEVSYHPLDFVLEHSSAHEHGEKGPSHPSDTQHNYENQIDWNVTRSQSSHNGTFYEQNPLFSIEYLPPAGFEKAISFHQEPASTKEQYASLSIIRGPPLFG